MNPFILLVEGPTKALSCAPLLEKKEYSFVSACSRREALARLQANPPDLLIVDARALRFDPVHFCEMLRENDNNTPLLLILPEGQKLTLDPSIAVLRGNVTIRRLANRVKRLLTKSQDSDILCQGDIVLDLRQRTVTRGNAQHRLTPRQARLLEVFMRHPNRVLTRAFLMKEVWKTDFLGDTRTLEVHVHWLRKAVEDDPNHPVCLTTVRCIGYRFAPLSAPQPPGDGL